MVRLVIADCDGVLTDGTVCYSPTGEELKRFSLRDGMGVERLRAHGVETAIVTREATGFAGARAAKLGITEVHLGVREKAPVVSEMGRRLGLAGRALAFIGDDINDLAVFAVVGLAACPADAFPLVREEAHYVCGQRGGDGAFRELAELILYAHLGTTPR